MAGSSVKSEFAAALTPAAPREVKVSRIELDVLELFDALQEKLFRYLTNSMLAAPDAEEIIQETFLALFQHLRRGGSRGNLRGWLFRVAHNLALKRRYRDRRGFQNLGSSLPPEILVPDPGLNPEDEFAARQMRARLIAVVRALPEQDRQCLILRAEGLRYRDIAEVLNMSLGSVSISLGRSLARISRAAER
jgi:RNA polymerase sigma-70 factor, ECF subfamily